MIIEQLAPDKGEIISLITDMHKRFFADGGNKESGIEAFDYLALFRQETDNSIGAPVVIKFKTDIAGEKLVYLSESESFDKYTAYSAPKNTVEIYNLFLGKKYFWKVVIKDDNEFEHCSEISYFITDEQTPRWIKASNSTQKSEKELTNIRDIGGWKTTDGKKIKQGLVYRGSEMDDHCILTDYAKKVLLEDLNIRVDYDLRKPPATVSPLGDGVKLIHIPMLGAYERISEFKEDYKKMIQVFADKDNYPMYTHCWGGADRTGTLIFLICGILGMSEEDLYIEYELTSFSVWGPRSSNSELFTGFKKELNKYGTDKDSIRTKCENFAYSTGITKEEINMIKSILIED